MKAEQPPGKLAGTKVENKMRLTASLDSAAADHAPLKALVRTDIGKVPRRPKRWIKARRKQLPRRPNCKKLSDTRRATFTLTVFLRGLNADVDISTYSESELIVAGLMAAAGKDADGKFALHLLIGPGSVLRRVQKGFLRREL